VAADLSTHARVSDVDARKYDRVTASGTLSASRVTLRSSTLPQAVAVDTVALTFTPQNARLTAFSAKVGTSDARATGSLDNLLGFVLRDQDLRGRATVTSDHFNVNEWKSKEKSTEVVLVPPHIDFDLDATAREVKYGPLTIANVKGNLLVKDQRVTMRNITMEMARGTIVANGFYETLSRDKPVFNMSVGLTTLDIPTFAALATVQQLAPIAKYAQGHVSGTMSLAGPLARDMSPVLTAIAGKGEITTDGLVLKGAPVMQKLSSSLSLSQLESPAIGVLHAAIDVADGRLHVRPFHVNVAGLDLTTSGSNGIDQSLAYDVALAVPRASLGAAATTAITKLASKAGQLGAQLPAGDVVQLQAKVTGTMTSPSVATSFAGMAASMTEATQAAAKQMASTAAASAKQKVDSTADAASAKARAEADRLLAEAERQADSIRAAGRALAEKLRSDADARIDSLVAKATNPIAKLAAQKAADKLRDQTKQQTDRVTQEANARADSVVALAKQKTAVVPKGAP
jgi:AsmA-like protein